MKDYRETFENKMTELLEKYTKKTGCEIKRPTLSFELKGRCAGTANGMKNLIRLNPTMIENPNHFDEMLNQTLGHELAHIIVRQRFKGCGYRVKPHGPEWQNVMYSLNLPATVTHNMEVVKARKTYRIEYTCSCRTHNITKQKHNKILKGARYSCNHCKEIITKKENAVFKAA